jgi:hypothetical protein
MAQPIVALEQFESSILCAHLQPSAAHTIRLAVAGFGPRKPIGRSIPTKKPERC